MHSMVMQQKVDFEALFWQVTNIEAEICKFLAHIVFAKCLPTASVITEILAIVIVNKG